MRVLGLDLSTKTGWSLFEDNKLIESGCLEKVLIDDFNVNKEPNKSPKYPQNIINGARAVAALVQKLIEDKSPDHIVIENTVKGKNRNTQRWLEWCHFCVITTITLPFTYLDPSEWRSLVGLKLNKEQKKNNREVSQGKKRGRVTKKHLSVNMVNEKFGLNLKIKDNDQADSILLTYAYTIKHATTQS